MQGEEGVAIGGAVGAILVFLALMLSSCTVVVKDCPQHKRGLPESLQ